MTGPSSSATRTRGRRRRAALLLLLLLATLLLGEGAARLLFDPPNYLLKHVYDPELGYRQPPNAVFDDQPDPGGTYSYRTNSLGFRSPELPHEPPPPGTKRVLFMGDSFGDGWGVPADALMPFSCQAELIARGHAVETFNASYAAIGTAQELLLFRRHGVSTHPDVVVLALYEGNDIVDNTPELVGQTMVSGGAYVRPFLLSDGEGGLETHWLNPWRAALRRYSRFYQTLELRLLTKGLIDDPEAADRKLTPRERVAAGHLPNRSLEILLPPEPGGVWETGWRRTEDILRVFRKEVEAAGARFVLVGIPIGLQVQREAMTLSLDDELRRAKRPGLDETVDWNQPEKQLCAFAAAEGITFVPLVETLREATATTRLSTYLQGGHLDANGHRRAGARLADALEHVLAGRTPPPAAVPTGAPVDLLDEHYAGVDFNTARHAEVLDYGWSAWLLVPETGGAGWLMSGRRAGIYVPARAGQLVLTGFTRDESIELQLTARGVKAHQTIRLGRGPFEVRLPMARPERRTGKGAAESMPELTAIGLDLTVKCDGEPHVLVTGVRVE